MTHKQLMKGFLLNGCFENQGMQLCLKSRQNSHEIPLKEFVFSTVVGLHLSSLLKTVTHPLQVFYKEIA